jgi:hypothetical protein
MESLTNALATSLMVSIPVSVLGCDGITYELGDFSPEDTILTVKWRLSELSHNDILTSSLYLTEDTRGETTRDFELKNTEQIHEVRSYLLKRCVYTEYKIHRGAPKKNKIESDVYLADDKWGR